MLLVQARPEHGMTKRSYTQAVLRAMQQYVHDNPQGVHDSHACGTQQRCPTAPHVLCMAGTPGHIEAALLLSIDRRENAVAAAETVAVAAQYAAQGVVRTCAVHT